LLVIGLLFLQLFKLSLVNLVDALDLFFALLRLQVKFGNGSSGDVEFVRKFAVLGLFLLESVIVLLVFLRDSLDLVVLLGED
jgi:hypothetical protein